MENKRGLTLIEVILSLAILGIISVGFLTAISSYFKFFTKTKQISREVFKTQQKIELMIDDVKENIINQPDPPGEIKTIEIWGKLNNNINIDIEYYEVQENYNDKIYATLISNIKPKVEQQLKLSDIGIKIKQGDKQVPYAYGTGEFSIIGNFENYYDPSNISTMRDHLRNVIEWYASSEEFNMPAPAEIASEEDLYYYPTFPKDYLIVENDSNDGFGIHDGIKLPNLECYKGRNIIFTVTPGARSGRIGIQSESIPVFISGLPITKNLVIHLDAAFINLINSTETTTDGRVNRWYDLSSIIGKSEPDEVANSGSSKPQLKKTEMEEAFRGQYVRFNNQNQTLNLTRQGTNGKNIYVFAAVRNNTENLENPLAITFLTISGTNQEIEAPVVYGADRVGEWIIIKKSINNAQGNNFEIGGPYADIAEIAVYNSAPSNEEIEEIESYFLSKYRTNVLVDNGTILIGGIESED